MSRSAPREDRLVRSCTSAWKSRSASCGSGLGGLPSPVEAQGLWRGIWLEEAHHSTAIEGNTPVLRQVKQLLDEGRAVGNKELREYMEVQGYANAADWVYSQGIEPGAHDRGARS
jgi:hypothetical protein